MLVLILIVTIIAVAALPTLKSFVVKAHYAGEILPCIGNLQTMIRSYDSEHSALPGLGVKADGAVAEKSQLAEGLSSVQTFSGTNTAAWVMDFGEIVTVTNGNHFAQEIKIDVADLTGYRGKAKHFQYRTDFCEANRHLYAVGAFGNGYGMTAGTGYAVIEIVNSDVGMKSSGVWKRYESATRHPKQVVMVNADEAKRYFKCETPKQAREMNLCWVGDTDALMSGDKTRVEQALKDLEVAGWSF